MLERNIGDVNESDARGSKNLSEIQKDRDRTAKHGSLHEWVRESQTLYAFWVTTLERFENRTLHNYATLWIYKKFFLIFT